MKRLLAFALALAFAVVAHAAPGKGTGLSSPVMTNFNKRDFLITLSPGTAPTNIIQLNWGGYTIPNPPAYDLPGTTWYIITNYISTNLASTNVLINPTDRYVPYRSNATTFGDSPLLRQSSTNVFTPTLQVGYDPTFWTDPRPDLSGRLRISNRGGGVINGIQFTGDMMASAVSGSLMYLQTGDGDAGDKNNSYGISLINQNNSRSTPSTGDPHDGAVGIWSTANGGGRRDIGLVGSTGGNSTNNIAILAWQDRENYDGRTNIALRASIMPPGAFNNTQIGAFIDVGTHQSTPLNESAMLLIDSRDSGYPLIVGRTNNGTVQFKVLSASGYTGTGANFLTDDGTYKSAVGAGLINPSNDYLPVRSNATTFVDSPLYRVALTNIATDGQIIFSPGTTNVLYRSGTDAYYTNGATQMAFKAVNGAGRSLSIGTDGGSIPTLESSIASLYLKQTGGSSFVVLNNGNFGPNTPDVLDSAIVTVPYRSGAWRTANVIGYNGPAASDYSRLEISQANTNSPMVFNLVSSGTGVNGVNQGFRFQTNGGTALSISGNSGYTGIGTNYLKDDGTFGPVIAASTNSANWTALGTTNSTLTGDAFVHSLLPTNGLQSVAGASATYIGTADIWNMGVNSSSASAIYNNCYSFYNLGTNSAHGVKATNSYSIFNFSLDGLEDAVLDGVANLFGFGADVFWQANISSSSYNLFGHGAAAGESTTISNSHDLYFDGSSAGLGGSFLNSLQMYMFGNRAGYSMSASASSEIYAFGGLDNATLNNTKNLLTLGHGAGDNINGAYTNVVLIGDGATIGATGENQIIAGPGMNMSLLGTLNAADLLTGGMSVYRGTLTHAGGNVIVDFSPTNRYWSCTITGAVTFVLTNAVAGKWANILLYNTQATNCTPTFNFPVGSKTNWFGGAPSTLTAGTVGSLSYYPTSTDTNAVLAAYTETQ